MKIFKYIWIVFLFILLSFSSSIYLLNADTPSLPGPVVSTKWLSLNRQNVVILDVRRVNDKNAELDKNSFISGALLVPFANVTREITVAGKKLKSMVLDKKSFAGLMSKAGVSNSDVIIITSPSKHLFELTAVTRLYWTAKYFGHDKVAILNGGNALWHSENRPMQNRGSSVKTTNYKSKIINSDILASIEDITKAQTQDIQILDVRGLEYYEGEKVNKAFVKAKYSGHIANALSLPIQSLTRQKRSAIWFQTVDEILDMADMMDIDLNNPTILYCDSGNYASLEWFIIHELIGNKKARLFDGSMHQWSIFNRPVNRGQEP
ncbi:MAG: sulfurtransferase [Magnetococcales bacterium]|nr:sulfurtransferase [Magnetococcales bacterium]